MNPISQPSFTTRPIHQSSLNFCDKRKNIVIIIELGKHLYLSARVFTSYICISLVLHKFCHQSLIVFSFVNFLFCKINSEISLLARKAINLCDMKPDIPLLHAGNPWHWRKLQPHVRENHHLHYPHMQYLYAQQKLLVWTRTQK